MSFKFRRRQKLFPGVYLNLSSKGISATVGIKGLNVNLNAKGAYLNAGIPGTGISSRNKIADWSDGAPKSTSNPSTYQPTAVPSIGNDAYYFLPKKLEGEIKSSSADSVTSRELSQVKETFLAAHQEKQAILNEIPTIQKDVEDAKRNKLLSKIFLIGFFTKKFEESYSEKTTYLNNINEQLVNCKVQLEITTDPAIESSYLALKSSFDALSKAKKIWDKTSSNRNNENKSSAGHVITRTLTNLSHRKIEFINADFDALYFNNQNGSDIYIYPAFVILFDSHNNFGMVSLSELKLSFKTTRFLEEESMPTDATVVGKTWAKVNKDGTPDKRFKANYQISIAQYGEIEFKSDNGIFEVFMVSAYEVAKDFVESYNDYASKIHAPSPAQEVRETSTVKIKNRTIISVRQSSISNDDIDSVFYDKTRNLSFFENSFRFELPTGTVVQGDFTVKSVDGESDKILCETDKGCPLIISENQIFINLYRTHNAAFTFYFD